MAKWRVASVAFGVVSLASVSALAAPVHHHQEWSCKFEGGLKGTDRCTAAVVICDELIIGPPPTPPICTPSFKAACNDTPVYSDNFARTFNGAQSEIIQGITSPENPTPPSIVLALPATPVDPPFDADATLNLWFESLEGTCHVVEVTTP